MKPTHFDLLLLLAQIRQESGFNPNAKSHAGAMGLFQIMPGTWNEIVKELRIKNPNPYNPLQNLLAGTYYLNKMFAMFGRLDLALTAYNWGPGNLQRAIKAQGTDDLEVLKAVMPKEAKEYAMRIFRHRLDPQTLERLDDFLELTN